MSASKPTSAHRALPTEPGVLRLAASGLFLEHPHTGTGRYARHVLGHLGRAGKFATCVIADDRRLARILVDNHRR